MTLLEFLEHIRDVAETDDNDDQIEVAIEVPEGGNPGEDYRVTHVELGGGGVGGPEYIILRSILDQ